MNNSNKCYWKNLIVCNKNWFSAYINIGHKVLRMHELLNKILNIYVNKLKCISTNYYSWKLGKE